MRQRGGFITTTPLTFSTSSASGVFTINDAAILRAATQWPRQPLAPTSLAASAGNTQISLSWTAPATTYGAITNYLVEYTPSGGSAAYVLTGSTSTSYTLTGLTNGTSYTVRVAAVNFTAGDWSGTATGTPQNALATPSFSRDSCNDGTVIYSWTSVAGATLYRFQGIYNPAEGSYQDVQVSSSRSWSGDVGGAPFRNWWFRVRAEGGALVSPYSNAIASNCPYQS
jgi:hypothetical protein